MAKREGYEKSCSAIAITSMCAFISNYVLFPFFVFNPLGTSGIAGVGPGSGKPIAPNMSVKVVVGLLVLLKSPPSSRNLPLLSSALYLAELRMSAGWLAAVAGCSGRNPLLSGDRKGLNCSSTPLPLHCEAILRIGFTGVGLFCGVPIMLGGE
jgi:hypothetical protein